LQHAFERALDDAEALMKSLDPFVRSPGAKDSEAGDFHRALESLQEVPGAAQRNSAPDFRAAYTAEARHSAAAQAPPVSPIQAARAFISKLKPELGARELTRLRRRFALAHHPDRVPPELRDEAARAMALANAHVDQVLKRARPV
jgi:hypothetical protein